jgi:hypothetical protein
MSLYLHQTMRTWQGCIEKDDTVVEPSTQYGYREVQRWDVEMYHLWPNSRWLNLGDATSDPNCPAILSLEDYWEWPAMNDLKSGKRWRQLYHVSGQCKDSGGNSLGPCIVDLFKTSDDTKVDTCVTDDSGNYRVYATENVAHYCVAYKTGSPDVAGATVNTLTGTAV